MTTKLPCPKCGGNQVRGIETRKACLNGHSNAELKLLPDAGITEGIKRRRKCLDCHWIFNTIEIGADELNTFLRAHSFLKAQLQRDQEKISELQAEVKRANFLNA